MKFAYNPIWLQNLHIAKEANRWHKQGWISKEQFEKISSEYPSSFYHPNLFIRILLFIATLIALSGLSGLSGLTFANSGETILPILCIVYGLGSWLILEKVFIKTNNHYKSGVNEALLYHSIGFIIGGIIWLTDGNIVIILVCSIAILTYSSVRFVDLISTIGSLGCTAYFIFYLMYKAGGIIQNLIAFGLIIFFCGFYFNILKLKSKKENDSWMDCLIVAEALSLLIIYAAGNYLVVRELNVSMMNLSLQEGQDIPFAWLFYFLTVAIPIIYLYFGIRKKDIVLIRVSLIAIAFAVFTFKYYFSLGHHEITLTAGGIILVGIALWLFHYLKAPKNGFTAENILSEGWGNANLSSFIISQTVGGNKTPERPDEMGGSFGGAGSTENF